jgi:hypothetical protein
MKDKFNLVGTEIKEFALPCYDESESEDTVSIRSFKGKKNVVVVLLRDIR